MAARTTSSRPSASNGRGATGPIEKAKATGNSVAKSARDGNGPALTAGAAVAGVAGGFALGSWRASKAPRGMSKVARAAGQLAQQLGSLTNEVASTGEDVRELQQLLRQANRRSPVEVLLDGLTHRRGGHKNES
jgi:hypothetical protein